MKFDIRERVTSYCLIRLPYRTCLYDDFMLPRNIIFGSLHVPQNRTFIFKHVKVFRAQEPKAPVTYCDHALSGVCRPSSVVRRLSVRPSSVRQLHFQLLFQNRLMNFDETWYWWSTQGPLQVLLFFGQIRPGADPGRGRNRSRGGVPSSNTSSSDQKATATNRMHSSDLEAFRKKCCYFWFHSEIKFLTRFWRLGVF